MIFFYLLKFQFLGISFLRIFNLVDTFVVGHLFAIRKFVWTIEFAAETNATDFIQIDTLLISIPVLFQATFIRYSSTDSCLIHSTLMPNTLFQFVSLNFSTFHYFKLNKRWKMHSRAPFLPNLTSYCMFCIPVKYYFFHFRFSCTHKFVSIWNFFYISKYGKLCFFQGVSSE